MASAGEAVDSATAAAAVTAAAFEASRSSLTAEHTTARLALTRCACDVWVGKASASGFGALDRSRGKCYSDRGEHSRSAFWMSPLGGTTHLGDSLGGDADERGLADNRGHL